MNRYQVIYINENNEKVMDILYGINKNDIRIFLHRYRKTTEIVSIKNLGKGY